MRALHVLVAALLLQAAVLHAAPSQTVPLAPAAEPLNGIDDIALTSTACGQYKDSLCKEVEAGEGRFADCILGVVQQRETEVAEGTKKADAQDPVSAACIAEILQYRIDRSKNINLNLPLAKACKDDAANFCKAEAELYKDQPGAVISCLRRAAQRPRSLGTILIPAVLAQCCMLHTFEGGVYALSACSPRLHSLWPSRSAARCGRCMLLALVHLAFTHAVLLVGAPQR